MSNRIRWTEDATLHVWSGRVGKLGAQLFSITSTEAEDVRACQDCEAMVYRSCSGCGHPAPVDMCPVREAIRAALAGKETGDGHPGS